MNMLENTAKNNKHFAETVYVGEFIDLKKVQENIKHYNYLNREQPLVMSLLKNQHVVLTKFGGVTFWNVDHGLRSEFLKEIKPFIKSKKTSYPYDEDTQVFEGSEDLKVSFDAVSLPRLGIEQRKIVSYVLSQSTALERYEDEIEASLSEVGVIVDNLKNRGKVFLSQKQVLVQIGKVLSVKQIAVTHLSLFDKPEEVWDSPELESLYGKMSFEYELRERFSILNEKIGYLSDISRMLMNFLAEKQNIYLEKVIIVLIAIDIIIWFIPSFPEVLLFFRAFF